MEIHPKARPAGMSKRDFNAAMKAMYLELGRHWKETYLPIHFTAKGARRYRYTPRAGHGLNLAGKVGRGSYLSTKKRYKGHTDPLVWSGTSRDMALSQSRVTSNRFRAAVAIRAPALNFKRQRRDGTAIDMTEEVKAITQTEAKEMARFAGRFLRKKLKDIQELNAVSARTRK